MTAFREKVRSVIFQHDAAAEKAFDVVLIIAIMLSVLAVTLDSVAWIRAEYGTLLYGLEWAFTIVFTIEYVARLWATDHRKGYALSFYGIVDLLSILPTYLGVIFPAGRFLIALRILRVLRVFRILKLVQYVSEASVLANALKASRFKITVFLSAVLTVVIVVGSMMYMIEGPAAGFSNIPQGIYWAIVTLTTVGYGDIAPLTPWGKALAATLMIVGYGVIAVPTGIVTLELERASRASRPEVRCEKCGADRHEDDAAFCRRCGSQLSLVPAT